MSKYSSKDVGFFQCGGRDIAGFVTSVSPKISAPNEQTTVLGVEWQLHEATGLKSYELSQAGFFDDAAHGVNVALRGQQGLAHILSLSLAGNVIGRTFLGFEGPLQSDYDPVVSINALHKANVTYRGSGQVDEGEILQHKTAQSGDWDTEATPVDGGAQDDAVDILTSSQANPSVITTDGAHGLVTGDTVEIAGHTGSTPDINGVHAVTVTGEDTFTIAVNVTVAGADGTVTRMSSRNGLAAYLQVAEDFDLDGYDDLTVSVLESDDDVVYTELVAFTAVTAGPGAERVTVAGNVQRYLAVAGVFGGAGTAPVATVTVGAARG